MNIKIRKKSLFLLISLLIVFSTLIGCGKNNQKEKEGKNDEIFYEGVSKNEIIVGMSASFRDTDASFIGLELYNGAMTYIKEINENGGINGRKITIKTYEDKYNPQTCMKNTLKLINTDGVLALFNYPGFTANSIVNLADTYKTPLIGISSGNELFRQNYKDYVFNVRASYQREMHVMVKYFTQKMKFTKIAVLYENNGVGKARMQTFKDALFRYKLEPVVISSYNPGSAEIEQNLNEIIEAKPEVVAVFSKTGVGGKFVNEAKKKNSNLYFYFTSELFEMLAYIPQYIGDTYELRERIFVTQPFPNPWETGTPFLNLYHELSNKHYPDYKLNFIRVEGFVNAILLVEAIKQAGDNLTRENLAKTIKNMGKVEIHDLKFYYGENDNQGLSKVYITDIRNGIFDTIE